MNAVGIFALGMLAGAALLVAVLVIAALFAVSGDDSFDDFINRGL